MSRKFIILTPPVIAREPQYTMILNWLVTEGFDLGWMVRNAAISCISYGKHVKSNRYVADEFANSFAEMVQEQLHGDRDGIDITGPEAELEYALIVEAASLFYDICLTLCNDLDPFLHEGELDITVDVEVEELPNGFRIDIEYLDEGAVDATDEPPIELEGEEDGE